MFSRLSRFGHLLETPFLPFVKQLSLNRLSPVSKSVGLSSSHTSLPIAAPVLLATCPPGSLGFSRHYSYGTVTLVISGGKPRFDVIEHEPPKKAKWLTKARLKRKRMRERKMRKEANKWDPRRIRPKGVKKQMFADAGEKLKYKIEKAKIKESLLVERLKRYEVPKVQGPIVKPEVLTGEERFYFKKMAQKRSNYVPVGRRGVFGGVILNMHMHWKKHETVKVFCKPCKPGQVYEYATEIARLSGGTPIQIIGSDTIIFYRGRSYIQPEVMSPVDTLSKKKALEKSKYEQSLETVRHFIALSEKELELYYRHMALCEDQDRDKLDTGSNGNSNECGTSDLKHCLPGSEFIETAAFKEIQSSKFREENEKNTASDGFYVSYSESDNELLGSGSDYVPLSNSDCQFSEEDDFKNPAGFV